MHSSTTTDDGGPWARASTLGDLLLRTAHEHPTSDAVVFPSGRWTYAQLADEARTVAKGLIALGMQPGDKVGYFMINSPQTVAGFFGIVLAGGMVVPINTRYRAVELPHVVAAADVSYLLTSDAHDAYVDLLGLLQQALPGLEDAGDPRHLELPVAPLLRSVVVWGKRDDAGTIDEATFRAGAAAIGDDELDQRRLGVRVGDVALLLFTSGTTSLPRAAELTHESLVRTWSVTADNYSLTEHDTVWVPCPMFHLGAIGPIVMCVSAASALLSDTYFEPDAAIAQLRAEQPQVWYSSYPPITLGILTHEDFEALDTSMVRAILNVAPPETQRIIQRALPSASLISLYGLTEGGGSVTLSRLDDDEDVRMTTDGRPLPGTRVRIVDPETQRDLGADEPGEILIRGVGLCIGYYHDEERTRAAFDEGGWLHTGDRGRLDAQGRLRFLGRLKDMLKVGGENVAAVEIESFLSTHPAVKLVQVVGVPDPRLDEIPVAVIETRPGHEVDEAGILAFCAGQLARFKIPRHVVFVHDWPMSASKVQKHRLREQVLETLGLHDPIA